MSWSVNTISVTKKEAHSKSRKRDVSERMLLLIASRKVSPRSQEDCDVGDADMGMTNFKYSNHICTLVSIMLIRIIGCIQSVLDNTHAYKLFIHIIEI